MKRCIKGGAGVEGARRAEVMVTLSRFKSHLKLFQEDVLEKINLAERRITDDGEVRNSYL